jgi:hypothetical protein
MWERRREGDTLHQIAQLFNRTHSSVRDGAGTSLNPCAPGPLRDAWDLGRVHHRIDLQMQADRIALALSWSVQD